ncbi:hypothetical protein PUN28_012777 [Cardiocondyla obscurior]|uniref:Cytochrome P450 n=1 Tax=Cardiocondyla obscurior TaxID=286306 RepID=A0AAW2F4L4_9HYME
MEPFEILCGIAAIIFILYYYFTWNFDFWKSRGVRGPQPIPGFGNVKDVILGKMSLSRYLEKVYNDYRDEPFIGIFDVTTPILIIKDLDLIKDILIKDFLVFGERGYNIHEKADPLSQNLFNLDLDTWRPLRTKLTPVFTSRKLKEMFVLISECSDHLVDYLEKLVKETNTIECHEVTAKYATDVIGNCAFGIEMDALANEDSEFRRIGRDVFRPPLTHRIRNTIKEYWPKLFDFLGHIVPDSEITSFFTRVIVDTMAYREKHNIVRHDFVNTLMELKNSDKLGDFDLTDSLLAAQAFIFFAAGYETSSTAMTNVLYELALNQKMQDRLRDEIDQEYLKHGNDFAYKNVLEMVYLDKIVKGLRKYPPGRYIPRRTTSSYTFNNTKVTIPKGQKVWIPFFAIHNDSNIYPKPDVFDPERFDVEAVQKRHPMSYLPFGDGPRICIGLRFAIYQVRVGLLKIIRNFKVEPCEKTQIPYVIDETNIISSPKGGIYLKVTKINRD